MGRHTPHTIFDEYIVTNLQDTVGVHGVLYNIRDFEHPGGNYLLKAYNGQDITALYETHHIHHERASHQLSKLPTCGKYDTKVNFCFRSYRRVRSRVSVLVKDTFRSVTLEDNIVYYTFIFLVIFSHLTLLSISTFSTTWLIACIISSFFNAVIGGYAHNDVHQFKWTALGLDWNGLSAFEWLHEHVHSHHMYTNTKLDHDTISMKPFLNWRSSEESCILNSSQKYLVYMVSEIVVLWNGMVKHRLRWKPVFDSTAPLWLRVGPFIPLLRILTHFVMQPPILAASSYLSSTALSGFYFSYLAHLNHASVLPDLKDSGTIDFLSHQLLHTHDIRFPCSFAPFILFLDRQVLHHLFPTIQHTQLSVLQQTMKIPKHDIRVLHHNVNGVLKYWSMGN